MATLMGLQTSRDLISHRASRTDRTMSESAGEISGRSWRKRARGVLCGLGLVEASYGSSGRLPLGPNLRRKSEP